MVQRQQEATIERWLFRNKVIIIYGARQVGKTTLAKSLLKKYGDLEGYYNCELPSIAPLLSYEPSLLKQEFGRHKLIVLDEAQFVPDIGTKLKIIADELPEVQIIATGSSSFELAQKTSEPLTGRALTFTLFPLSYQELLQLYRPVDLKAKLDALLRYGSYPELVTATSEEARILLDDLAARYLYKDVLMFENLRRPESLHKLLQLLAHQIGSEVSTHELAKTLKINERTVSRYIDLLEKAFVIFSLSSLSGNLRKEISKKKKIYFYDVGIRNSIIQQYQPMDIRNDRGALWENFLIVERMKMLSSKQQNPRRYFWRTHDQQEVDYLEESDGILSAYEFKWQTKKNKIPTAFEKAYPEAAFQWIDQSNFTGFVSS
ncbi:MAG: ATP-binding protein [Cyclobacteriaceae bacterium]